jgi:hypothetical protein
MFPECWQASLEEIVGATSSSDTPHSLGCGTVEIFRWMPDLDEDPDHDDAEVLPDSENISLIQGTFPLTR